MVSTYLSYDLVNRDLQKISRQGFEVVAGRTRATIVDANISKVSTVDEFMDDYRLYAYAMKAHGLEDMTYAKAFRRRSSKAT